MTNECLLIGFSKFARRRVIPAIADLNRISSLHIASRTATDNELAALPKCERVFRDYQEAIDECPPGVVYVSLHNEAHALWVERALKRGHHVVVDKPAFTTLATAERLVALAQERSLLLAEATTYAFHPVVAEMTKIFHEKSIQPTHITASFTPLVPLDNYRYRRKLGGGALLDTGPYCASLGRLIWGAAPQHVSACINSYSADGEVDTSYSVLARYGANRVLIGHFGFTTEYTNHVQLLGASLRVDVPRVFSTPPDMVTRISAQHRNEVTTHSVPAVSTMHLFMTAVLSAIAHGDYAAFASTLLADARVLDQIRRATTQWS